MVRHRILLGARKWYGPRLGLVTVRLARKRSYFICWRTMPPEIAISSVRTATCNASAGRVSAQRGRRGKASGFRQRNGRRRCARVASRDATRQAAARAHCVRGRALGCSAAQPAEAEKLVRASNPKAVLRDAAASRARAHAAVRSRTHNVLAAQQLLGDDRRQAAQHVGPAVNHNRLRGSGVSATRRETAAAQRSTRLVHFAPRLLNGGGACRKRVRPPFCVVPMARMTRGSDSRAPSGLRRSHHDVAAEQRAPRAPPGVAFRV